MKDIEKLETLPYKESFSVHSDSWDRYWYGGKGKMYGNKYAWDIVERILNKFKGKQANKAFSAYCKIVDVDDQYRFWEELDRVDRVREHRGEDYDMSYWFLDKNNNIQYHKKKKKEVIYRVESADYEEGYVDHMGNVITTKEYYKIDSYPWMDTRWSRALAQKWRHVVIRGEVFEFKKKTPEFYRCVADEQGKREKMHREYLKYAEKKAYSFLTREEEEKIKDKDTDIIKRDAHGFDGDSFTNNNGRLNS